MKEIMKNIKKAEVLTLNDQIAYPRMGRSSARLLRSTEM